MPRGRPRVHPYKPEPIVEEPKPSAIGDTDLERRGEEREDPEDIVQPEPKKAATPQYTPPKDPKYTLLDVKITKKEKESGTWGAVFKCTNPHPVDAEGNPSAPHKTKATNKTPASQVPCHKCGWPTEMVDIFKHPPIDYRSIRVREPDREDFTDA